MADEYATLRAAFHAGETIQAWTLHEVDPHGGWITVTSADGYWRDLPRDSEPKWSCPVHLYRVQPDGEA